MRTVRILVSCGSGVATSMHVAVKLREEATKAGLRVSVDGCSVNELPYRSGSYDVIVSTAQVPFDLAKPVFNAVPFLTGLGEEPLLVRILNTVREIAGKQ
ncbi:MAG: PTS sugar transporter subunit IIB [Ignavibacteriales bacterium]